jgi:hypothetical protein
MVNFKKIDDKDFVFIKTNLSKQDDKEFSEFLKSRKSRLTKRRVLKTRKLRSV